MGCEPRGGLFALCYNAQTCVKNQGCPVCFEGNLELFPSVQNAGGAFLHTLRRDLCSNGFWGWGPLEKKQKAIVIVPEWGRFYLPSVHIPDHELKRTGNLADLPLLTVNNSQRAEFREVPQIGDSGEGLGVRQAGGMNHNSVSVGIYTSPSPVIWKASTVCRWRTLHSTYRESGCSPRRDSPPFLTTRARKQLLQWDLCGKAFNIQHSELVNWWLFIISVNLSFNRPCQWSMSTHDSLMNASDTVDWHNRPNRLQKLIVGFHTF